MSSCRRISRHFMTFPACPRGPNGHQSERHFDPYAILSDPLLLIIIMLKCYNALAVNAQYVRSVFGNTFAKVRPNQILSPSVHSILFTRDPILRSNGTQYQVR